MLLVDIKKNLGSFKLNIKLDAQDGVTGILGASGCGKSMTLRCIAGIEKPDEGHIALDGVTLFDSKKGIDLVPQKRKVGYLFQSYALFPNMTVEKNILCCLYHEKNRNKRRQELEEVIGLLKLEGLEKLKPAQLSGGQQQRTALARILVNKPRLLMLDEPFSALDSHLRSQLQIQMKKLLEQYGGKVLLVTHNRNEAYNLCQNLAVMDSGVLFAPKPTKELFDDPVLIAGAVMTGCKNITPAVKTGEYEIEAPEWGVRLITARPVREGLCAVGIRAHYFSPKISENSFPVRFTDEIEEPFENTFQFRYANQADKTPDIWWSIPKAMKGRRAPPELGIAPENILLLYQA